MRSAVQSEISRVWRPAGVWYLLALLVGLAIGLWPEAILPSKEAFNPAPLPTLQTIAVAQVGFILLIHPLILLWRQQRGERFSFGVVLETAAWFLIGLPLYGVGAYFSDGTFQDAVRTVVAVACLWPVALAIGAWLTAPRVRPAVILGLLIVALGLPAGVYLMREFAAQADSQWLEQLAPATFFWQMAAARQPTWLPRPLWAWLLWPAVAAALLVVRWAFVPKRTL